MVCLPKVGVHPNYCFEEEPVIDRQTFIHRHVGIIKKMNPLKRPFFNNKIKFASWSIKLTL